MMILLIFFTESDNEVNKVQPRFSNFSHLEQIGYRDDNTSVIDQNFGS